MAGPPRSPGVRVGRTEPFQNHLILAGRRMTNQVLGARTYELGADRVFGGCVCPRADSAVTSTFLLSAFTSILPDWLSTLSQLAGHLPRNICLWAATFANLNPWNQIFAGNG